MALKLIPPGQAADESAGAGSFTRRTPRPQELWFRSHVTVGEIYERLGRADEARRKYEALVKIWKDGDPQVALNDARARLAKL